MVQFCWDVGTRTRPNAIGLDILTTCFLTCPHHLKCQRRNAMLRLIEHDIFCLLVRDLFILYGCFPEIEPSLLKFGLIHIGLILFSLVQISYCSVMFPHLCLVPYSLHTTSWSYCSAGIQAEQSAHHILELLFGWHTSRTVCTPHPGAIVRLAYKRYRDHNEPTTAGSLTIGYQFRQPHQICALL